MKRVDCESTYVGKRDEKMKVRRWEQTWKAVTQYQLMRTVNCLANICAVVKTCYIWIYLIIDPTISTMGILTTGTMVSLWMVWWPFPNMANLPMSWPMADMTLGNSISMVNHPSLGDLPMKTTPFFSRFRRLGGSNESHEALAIGLREPQLGVAALDEHQTFLLHLTWNGLEGCL